MIRATPRVQTRARQIAEATGAHPVLSFATATPGFHDVENVHAAISAENLSSYKCTGCSTSMVTASVIPKPHCVNCGSHSLKREAASAMVPASLTTDEHLAGVSCSVCASLTVTDKRVLASLESIHCSACGSSIKHTTNSSSEETMATQKASTVQGGTGVAISEPGAAPEAPAVLDAAQPDTPPVIKGDDSQPQTKNDHGVTVDAASEEKEDSKEEEKKEEAAADEDNKEDGDKPKEEAAADDDKGEEEPKEEEKKEEATSVSAEADDSMSDAELDGLAQDLADDTVNSWTEEIVSDEDLALVDDTDMDLAAEMTGDVSDEMLEGIEDLGLQTFDTASDGLMSDEVMDEMLDGEPILEVMEMDDSVVNCALVNVSAGRTAVMKGHYTVALLTRERAGKNADIMQNESFANAVIAHASKVGLRKALAAFKFEPIRVKNVQAAAAKRQKASAEVLAKDQVVAALKIQADSLAIAAAGIARGMFKGVQNPLKAALEAEFDHLGVRNAGRVAARLLAEHGMEYAKVLCSQAQQIAARSETARRELADTLDLVSDQPMDDVLSDADEVQDNQYAADDFDFDVDAASEIADTVSARFSRPAIPRNSSQQVAALLQPYNRVQAARVQASSAEIDAQVRAILSGGARLSFGE